MSNSFIIYIYLIYIMEEIDNNTKINIITNQLKNFNISKLCIHCNKVKIYMDKLCYKCYCKHVKEVLYS